MFLAFFLIAFNFSLFQQNGALEQKALHNSAETYFSKGDFEMARQSYSALLESLDKENADAHFYIDVALRTATLHLLMHENEEGEAILLDLLHSQPPLDFLPTITVLLARIYSEMDKGEEGYLKMKEVLSLVPIDKWKSDEKIFFHAIEYMLNELYENLLVKAKNMRAIGSHKEALEIYEKVLSAIQRGVFSNTDANPFICQKIEFLIAETYVLLGAENEEEISEFISLKEEKRSEYEEALLSFKEEVSNDNLPVLIHYMQSLFEVGHHYYKIKEFDTAKKYLEILVSQKKGRPPLIGALFLGRIYLNEKKERLAENAFSFTEKYLAPQDPLIFEVYYLQAECSFQKKEYALAKALYEKALSLSGKGEWVREALRKLGLCCLFLSKNDDYSEGEKKAFYTKFEKIFAGLSQ